MPFFVHLLHHFTFYFHNYIPFQIGRSPTVKDAHQALGLIFTFYCDPIGLKNLCFHFGSASSLFCRTLIMAEIMPSSCCANIEEASMSWHHFLQQIQWSHKISSPFPLIRRKWSFLDGTIFLVENPSNHQLQNAY